MANGYIPAQVERGGRCDPVKIENRAFLGGVLSIGINGELQPISDGIVDLTFIEEDLDQATAAAAQSAAEAQAAQLEAETANTAAQGAKADAQAAASDAHAAQAAAEAAQAAAQSAQSAAQASANAASAAQAGAEAAQTGAQTAQAAAEIAATDAAGSATNADAAAQAAAGAATAAASGIELSKTVLPFGWESGGIDNSSGNAFANTARARSSYYNLKKGSRYTIVSGYQFVAYEYNLAVTAPTYTGIKISAYTDSYTATDNATVCFVVKKITGEAITSDDRASIKMYINNEPENEIARLIANGFAEDITADITDNLVLVGTSARSTTNSSYCTTDYIPVSPSDILAFNAVCGGTIATDGFTGLYGYNSKQELVGVLANLATYGWYRYYSGGTSTMGVATFSNQICVVPNGVSFVRLSSKIAGDMVAEPTVYRLSIGDQIKRNSTKLDETVGETDSITKFVNGSLNSSGNESAATNRIRTGFISLGGKTVHVTTNGQKVAYCLYNSAKSFLINSGWKYSDFDLTAVKTSAFVRFVVAQADDADLTPDDLDADISVSNGLTEYVINTDALAKGFVKTPYSETVEVVMHRGYNSLAPENTIPAFKLARQMGFGTIETDVQLTSDGVPVILHDATINRTSNSTGNVYDKTLEQLKALDFGSWKSSMWAGTTIPTFEEMLACCKKIGLNVYIEIKQDSPWTQAQIENCVMLVRKYGMTKGVSWISFSETLLGYVKNADETAKLGLLMTTYTSAGVDKCVALRTGKNEVMAVTRYDLLTDAVLEYMVSNNVPLGAYLFDSNTDAEAMQGYVTMALTNEFNPMEYIYKKNIEIG